MCIELEHLPGEPIIIATFSTMDGVENHLPAMFAELIQLRQTNNRVSLILDLTSATNYPKAFSDMVVGLAQAGLGIRESLAVNPESPTITIFVGSDDLTEMATQAIMQEQYGSAKAERCATVDEAIELARSRIAA